MKNNWTPFRILYLILGPIVVFQTGVKGDYLGIAMGVYLFSMGLFGLGCGSGNGAAGNCEMPQRK